jgi:hypothetical protein
MYEMQGPRQAGPEIPRRLPRRAGPLGQSANHTPFVLPPVQDTRWDPGCPVSLLPQNQLLSPPGLPLKVRKALQSAQSCLRTTERSEVLGAPSRLPGVSPRSPEVPSEWYPFSLVEKFLQPSVGAAQGDWATIFKILWPSTGCPPDRQICPPMYAPLSTACAVFHQGHPQVKPARLEDGDDVLRADVVRDIDAFDI